MSQPPTIFVQIASYRDPELLPTLQSLFAQAARPQRISVGICQQYGAGEAVKPQPQGVKPQQLRWHVVPYEESRGVCWARSQVQALYQGEDYTLAIDSHMRFVKGWDDLLLAEWKKCKNDKAVITSHPPGYIPPNTLASPGLTVLRASQPSASGEIRLRGEPLKNAPKAPLPGAFACPGFMFARGEVIGEVPYDPFLYFEQEEICLSARLYTHGWQVFHPTKIIAYHLYNTTPVSYTRHSHWGDHADWSNLNRIARERRDHLLGYQEASSPEALADLDNYGHGDAHSIEEYGEFCGIDFATRSVGEKVLNCGFIPGFSPAVKPVAVKAAPAVPTPVETAPPKLISKFLQVPTESFTPKTLEVLEGLPLGKSGKKTPAPKIIDAPPGVLVIENYATKEFCKKLCDYADSMAGRKLEVVDNSQSTRDKVVTLASSGRITEHVAINGAINTILPTFIDIYESRLAPFYGVNFEWFERPQILRYPAGGKYDPHADAEHLDKGLNQWVRSQDRDISVLLYLNEEYEGGEIGFPPMDFFIKPKAGMLLAFPSDHRYLHAAKPTTSGLRYVIVSWAATLGSPRAQSRPPYASVHMHLA